MRFSTLCNTEFDIEHGLHLVLFIMIDYFFKIVFNSSSFWSVL